MVTVPGGDSAVGLSTDSQTNTVAVYDPVMSGVHDCAGERDWPGLSEPSIHESETVTPLASCICTRYANDCTRSWPLITSAVICTCWSADTEVSVFPKESTTLAFETGALSSGGTIVPMIAEAVTSMSSLVLYGFGSVPSVYSAEMVSPSATRRRWPEDSSVVVKKTVPSNTPVASFVSVTVRSMPPESESEYTSTSKLSTASGSRFMSRSMTLTTPVPCAG